MNNAEFIAHYADPKTANIYFRTHKGFICEHGSTQAKELKNPSQVIEDGQDLCLVPIESVVYLQHPVYWLSDLLEQL